MSRRPPVRRELVLDVAPRGNGELSLSPTADPMGRLVEAVRAAARAFAPAFDPPLDLARVERTAAYGRPSTMAATWGAAPRTLSLCAEAEHTSPHNLASQLSARATARVPGALVSASATRSRASYALQGGRSTMTHPGRQAIRLVVEGPGVASVERAVAAARAVLDAPGP